jgi:hypothetical protein
MKHGFSRDYIDEVPGLQEPGGREKQGEEPVY